MFFKLDEFWRVGYHVDPLSVSLEYQGGGRFDDPNGEFTVLYGSDSAETCIIEKASPWKPHEDSPYTQQAEAPISDDDHDLQRAELEQAERDREIAMRSARIPVDLYESAKVLVELAQPVVLLDLDDVGVRTDLVRIPEIAQKMRLAGVSSLDRSVLLGRHLDITRAISGFVMRNQVGRHQFDGLRMISRHQGDAYVLFEGRYRLGIRLVGPMTLHREDPDVVNAALKLRLVP
ncbi:MAG: RES family NAD+ phosphorylase [Candidatus Eremiobacteraeota bacterium]|nr:RES family NAD+ phosphorylase [Candidatus Eremiobacteraeota bacterium]